MITVLLVAIGCSVVASLATAGILTGFFNAKLRHAEKFYREDIDERVQEALITARRRELADARRTTMPRSDAGQPAVVRPAFSRIPPRNP